MNYLDILILVGLLLLTLFIMTGLRKFLVHLFRDRKDRGSDKACLELPLDETSPSANNSHPRASTTEDDQASRSDQHNPTTSAKGDVVPDDINTNSFANSSIQCCPIPCPPPTSEMDPLIAKTYQNVTQSNLLKMPDELLLQVMKLLNPKALRSVRKVSRRFLYLFSSNEFRDLHDPGRPKGYSWQAIWPSMKPPPTSLRNRRTAKARTGYCNGCRRWLKRRDSANLSPEVDFFHCSGCGSDHHARLFSSVELQKGRKERVCIGREGYLSLCDHVQIKFAEIESHRPGGLDQWFTQWCKHPSHSCASSHILDKGHTYVCVRKGYFAGEQGDVLQFVRRTHIKLPTIASTRPTAQQLRTSLHELEETSRTIWYPMHNPRISPMKTVDPNKCHCFNYEGSDRVRLSLRPDFKAKAKRDSLWPGLASKHPEAPQCDALAHGEIRMFHYFDTQFMSALDLCSEINADECCGLLRCRWLMLDQPWKPSWIYALDPKSYGKLRYGYHRPCRSRQCRNYMQYETFGPLFGTLGENPGMTELSNRPCGKGCTAK